MLEDHNARIHSEIVTAETRGEKRKKETKKEKGWQDLGVLTTQAGTIPPINPPTTITTTTHLCVPSQHRLRECMKMICECAIKFDY